MFNNIKLSIIWSDATEDLIQLEISVSDQDCTFLNKVYTSLSEITQAVNHLEVFKSQVHGGIFDFRFGSFGPEYACGAFLARCHFLKGRLHISVQQESEYFDFGTKNVARESSLFLSCDPSQLDEFISELKALRSSSRTDATLNCI